MNKTKYLISILLICFLLISGSLTVGVVSKKISNEKKYEDISKDFYFVQITDTHVLHKNYDENERSKERLNTVLEKIVSFNPKPAFVVLTGDLVEWGGCSSSGALNFQTFVECFYKISDQFYADADFSIPVYMIPGNHDYRNNLINPLDIDKKLSNYHLYVNEDHIDTNDNYIANFTDTSLFFLNSGHDYLEDPSDWARVLGDGLYDKDIQWLENALNSSKSENKIILMHHPAVNDRDEFGVMIDVIARNQKNFIKLCSSYDVEMVLTGHTHRSVVYDSQEKAYHNLPLNCSRYPTLFVQTDDCKQGIHYRNISYINGDFLIENTKEIKTESNSKNKEYNYPIIFKFIDNLPKKGLLKSILLKLVNANLAQMF